MDDNSIKTILGKLKALRNLRLEDEGLLRAKELRQIIEAQMDLTTSLFEQQHNDIKKLSKSSSRLEKLTSTLIGLTIVLVVITIIENITIIEKFIKFFIS